MSTSHQPGFNRLPDNTLIGALIGLHAPVAVSFAQYAVVRNGTVESAIQMLNLSSRNAMVVINFCSGWTLWRKRILLRITRGGTE